MRYLLGIALVLGCTSDPPPPTTPPPSAPAPTPIAASVTPAPTTEIARPADPPKPAVPTLPDGTAIVPCADAPANMSCIPGGRFVRGTNDGPENAGPQLEVFLQTFYLDRFEVTIAEYKACVKRGDCRKGGPFYPDFSRPHQPNVGMSWISANQYCRAHGKRLPTEAQWEAAARGSDGEAHPWGDDPATCKRAVIRDKKGRSCGIPMARSSEPYKGRTFVVGSRAAGRYGLFDMAGNAWEYVADWYAPDLATCGAKCSGVDPKGPCDGADTCAEFPQKVVKGGSWYWSAELAAGWVRRAQPPNNSPFHHYGFRCAATVDDAAALRGKPASPEAPVVGERNEDAARGL